MEKTQTCLNLRKDIKERAEKALDAGKFTGIYSLTGLIENALDAKLKTVEV